MQIILQSCSSSPYQNNFKAVELYNPYLCWETEDYITCTKDIMFTDVGLILGKKYIYITDHPHIFVNTVPHLLKGGNYLPIS